MNAIKMLFVAVAIILGTVIALAAIGMIMTAMQYLFWLGVICLVAVVAIKLSKKSAAPQLESRSDVRELENAGRTLAEYKRKYLAK